MFRTKPYKNVLNFLKNRLKEPVPHLYNYFITLYWITFSENSVNSRVAKIPNFIWIPSKVLQIIKAMLVFKGHFYKILNLFCICLFRAALSVTRIYLSLNMQIMLTIHRKISHDKESETVLMSETSFADLECYIVDRDVRKTP